MTNTNDEVDPLQGVGVVFTTEQKRIIRTFEQLKAEWDKDPEYQRAASEQRLLLDIGDAVFYARQKANMTYTELARRAETTPYMIAKIESCCGARLDIVSRVLHELGIKFEQVEE